MATYLIIGDPHVTNKSLETAELLFLEVEKQNLPTIWLGDFLDTKEVVSSRSLNSIYKYFKNSKLKHYVIIGNHDWHTLDCQDHSLEVLKELDNVIIVDKPLELDNMTLLPYYKDLNTLREWINASNKPLLIGHLDIIGFDYGNGYICENGLTNADFTKFDMVISGHFHKYQQKDNIIYLGTPFSHSFGEANQIKYLGKLNSKSHDLELLPTSFRGHVSHELDLENPVELDLNLNNYNRIILKGSSDQILSFDKSIYSEFKIKWIEKPNITVNNILIDESLDNVIQFKEWATNIAELPEDVVNYGINVLQDLK